MVASNNEVNLWANADNNTSPYTFDAYMNGGYIDPSGIIGAPSTYSRSRNLESRAHRVDADSSRCFLKAYAQGSIAILTLAALSAGEWISVKGKAARSALESARSNG